MTRPITVTDAKNRTVCVWPEHVAAVFQGQGGGSGASGPRPAGEGLRVSERPHVSDFSIGGLGVYVSAV